MAYQTAILTGTYKMWDGVTPAQGLIEIIPNSRALIDAEGDVILSGRVKVTLDETGSFSVTLPATDDTTVEPADDRQYAVSAKLKHTGLKAVAGIELAAGETVDMADVTPVAEAAAAFSVFLTAEEYAADMARVAALEGVSSAQATALAAKLDTVQREQSSGVAGLTAAGKLYEVRIPDRLSDLALTATYGAASSVREALRATLRQGALMALPNIATRTVWPNNLSTNADPRNCRIRHVLTSNVTEVRLLYVNQYGTETKGSGSITVEAGVELPDTTILPVTFNGATSVVIPARGAVLSDPVSVVQARGTILRSRTFVTSAGTYPIGFGGAWFGTNEDGGEVGPSVTSKAASGTIPVTGSVFLYGPTAIIGRDGSRVFQAESFLGIGDSIMFGQGDDSATFIVDAGKGFFARALAGTRNYLNLGYSGELASDFATISKSRLRRALAQGHTRAVCEYGRNDVSGGATAAAVAANLIAAWSTVQATGAKVWQTTITPKSASTDGYLTTAGQTTDATNAARATLNDWLRDGAPIQAGAYVVTGSSGGSVLRAGAAGHPLSGYFDVADTLESTRNSGLWKQDPTYRSVAGIITTSGSNNITTATPQFTAADQYKTLLIPGAGTGGTDLIVEANFYNGPSGLGLSAQAQASLSGVTGFLGFRQTTDGTHPLARGHLAMAAAVNVAAMETP